MIAGVENDVIWKYGKHFMFPTFPHHLENGKAVSHIPTASTTIYNYKIKYFKGLTQSLDNLVNGNWFVDPDGGWDLLNFWDTFDEAFGMDLICLCEG